MSLWIRLLYMFGVLLLGIAGRSFGVLDDDMTGRLNQVAFYVLLPALVFVSTYDEPLEEIVSVTVLVGMCLVLFLTVALSWIVHYRTDSDAVRGVATVQSYHSNFGYLGLPFVTATVGGAAAAKASLILGVGALVQVPMTILVLVALSETAGSVRDELRSVLLNPVLLALVIGLLFSATQVAVPQLLVSGLDGLSNLALPVALLCVGASVELALPRYELETVGSVVALKVLCMPAVAWLVFTALQASPSELRAGVLMFGAPTAVSTYIYVSELGGDERIASVNIFVTTIASFLTLSALVQLLP